MKEILEIIGIGGKWLILFPIRLLFFFLNFIPTTVKSCRTCNEATIGLKIYYQETGPVHLGTFLYAWNQGFYRKYELIEGGIVNGEYFGDQFFKSNSIPKEKKMIHEDHIAYVLNVLSLFH